METFFPTPGAIEWQPHSPGVVINQRWGVGPLVQSGAPLPRVFLRGMGGPQVHLQCPPSSTFQLVGHIISRNESCWLLREPQHLSHPLSCWLRDRTYITTVGMWASGNTTGFR